MNSYLRVFLKSLLVTSLLAGFVNLRAQGTAFTYQGMLDISNVPANGSYDLYFSLYATNVLATNAQGSNITVAVAGPLAETNTPVTNGLFTVSLNFGSVFNGSNYWVQISAATNGTPTNEVPPLSPLLPITPTPYAISASNLLGTLPVAQLSGTISAGQLATNVVTNTEGGITLSGTFSGNGAGLTGLSAANINNSTVASLTNSNNVISGIGAGLTSLSAANINNSTVASLTNSNNIISGNGAGLTGVIASSVITNVSFNASNAIDFTNVSNSYVGTGITNYGIYFQTNSSSNGAYAVITTNAHLHLTDEWGTTYNTHTNGALTITMTNGTTFNLSNGSLALLSNGVGIQYSQGSLVLSSNLTVSNNATIGGTLNVTGAISGSGAGLSNVTAANIVGILTNSITGNAATATSVPSLSNALGSAAFSNSAAFQPASTELTNLANSNGASLFNLNAGNLLGILPYGTFTNFPGNGAGTILSNTGSGLQWAVSPTGGGGGAALLTNNNTWAGTNTFTNTVIATNGASNVFAGTFFGNGGGLTNVTNFVATNFTGSNFSGNGAGLTNLPIVGTAVMTNSNPYQLVINSTGGGSSIYNPSQFDTNGSSQVTIYSLDASNLTGTLPSNLLNGVNGAGLSNVSATFLASGAAVGSGTNNTIGAGSYDAFIGGGSNNVIQINATNATIGGGDNNIIETNSYEATIGGGGSLDSGTGNSILANSYDSTIAGGTGNTVHPFAYESTISGGFQNSIGQGANVATVAGGQGNTASGELSAVGGGFLNTSSGNDSVVPGGANNIASGQYSFAAGQQATAANQGSFVWADSQNAVFSSTSNDQFLVRAANGVGINTNNANGAALNVNGTVVAASFSGSGASLTGLNGSSLTNLPLQAGTNITLSTNGNIISINSSGGGGGSGVTNLTLSNINGSIGGLAGFISGTTLSLTETNNTNIATAAMVTSLSNALGSAAFTNSAAFQPASTILSNITSAPLTNAAAFQPAATELTNLANSNGAALFNLTAANIVGVLTNSTTGNAATVSTVAYSNYPVGSSNTFLSNNGVSVVWAPIPTAGGAAVDTTNITTNANGQLTAGTNLAVLNATQTFTGSNTFQGALTVNRTRSTNTYAGAGPGGSGTVTNIVFATGGLPAGATWSTNLFNLSDFGGALYFTNGASAGVLGRYFTNFFQTPFPFGNPPIVVATSLAIPGETTSGWPVQVMDVTTNYFTVGFATAQSAHGVGGVSWNIVTY